MMRHALIALALICAVTTAAWAQAQTLKPGLAGLGFLVGTWTSDDGRVAETGGTSRGSSTIAIEAGGAVLLRKDHTELFGRDGKPNGSFDQIMMIYGDDGAIHADYADGTHVIHYTSAQVVPGTSVSFVTDRRPNAPSFRLTYRLVQPATLSVLFEVEPPGASSFTTIASGTLHKT